MIDIAVLGGLAVLGVTALVLIAMSRRPQGGRNARRRVNTYVP
jgi:hypothetical protein